MNDAIFLKMLFVVLLLWKITSSNRNVLTSISKRQIFYKENINSINSLQIVGTNINLLMRDNPYVVYTALECKYSDTIVELLQTFFEINVYGINAPTEIQRSGIKVLTKKWLTSSINHFNSIKVPIAKMIDNLFLYLERHAELQTSDHSLLKSLLSINLFLYHSIEDCPFIFRDEEANDNAFDEFIQNIRILNKSIIQIIGLVERFRNKRCVVRDPYKQNYFINQKLFNDNILITNTNNINTLLNPSMTELHLFANNESDDYTNFESDKYDPAVLLFEKFLDYKISFLERVQLSFTGNESDLFTKYNDINRTYSIENILDYQYSLINVIADIFYAQIYNFVSQSASTDDLEILQNLNENFKHILVEELLPVSCSINVCNKILKAYYFFSQALKNKDHSNLSEMFCILENKFKPDASKETMYEIIQYEFNNDPCLTILSDYIISFKHVSFLRVFNLLSYESHTNSDFYIVKKFDQGDLTYYQSINSNFLNRMIELQCALFAFRTLLRTENRQNVTSMNNLNYSNFELGDFFSDYFITPENLSEENELQLSEEQYNGYFGKYGPVFANMLRVIVRLYNLLHDKPDVQKILLPLLIHFRNADKNACQNFVFQYLVMYQTSFVTITLIENYLVKNNLCPLYSLFIYSKLMVYDQNGHNASDIRNDIQTYLVRHVQPATFKNSLRFLFSLYNKTTYNSTLFPSDDEEVKYLWYGEAQTGKKILRNLQRSVIDINDLISFQWFGIKWFVGKILKSVKYALLLLRDQTKTQVSYEINTIEIRLNELLNLELLPMTIHAFLEDTIEATFKTLNYDSPSFDYDVYTEWIGLYNDSLEALGLQFEYEYEYGSGNYGINEIITALDFDMNMLNIFLQVPFLSLPNILISTELSLLGARNLIFDKSIQILYKY